MTDSHKPILPPHPLRIIRNCLPIIFFFSTFSFSQWKQTPGTDGEAFSALVTIGESIVAAGRASVVIIYSRKKVRSIALPGNDASHIVALANEGRFLYAATGKTIYRTVLDPVRWEILGSSHDGQFCCMTAAGGEVVAGTENGTVEIFSGTEGGGQSVRVAARETEIHTIIVSHGSYIAGSLGEGVFLSAHRPDRWRRCSKGLTNLFIYSLEQSGPDILAGTVSGSVFRLPEGRSRWVRADERLPYTAIRCLVRCGSFCLAGSWGKGVYQERDGQYEWREISEGLVGEGANTVNALVVAGADIYAATEDGLWRRPVAELAVPIEFRSPEILPGERARWRQ
jgi:hypothetical protein